MFEKYQHVERFGADEVADIELGTCLVFPKIDGANASVWLEDGEVCGGSRNRELTDDADNAGFFNAVKTDPRIRAYLEKHPNHRVFGEWLVPHSLKTYRDDAWRRFWIFDIMDGDRYVPYDEYKPDLDAAGLDYIPPVAVIKNATIDTLMGCLDRNTFLIKDGHGLGEGLVIKNYAYKNRFGRTVWAKIVRTEFKEIHNRTMGAPVVQTEKVVEEAIVAEFVTEALIEKELAKIVNEAGAWSSKMIPRLLGVVFYSLVAEECWSFVKKFSNPKVDFKRLNQYTILKIKSVKPELF